jgi:RHS repeat-associated protein
MMLPFEQNWIVQTVAVPTCDQSGCTYYESNYQYIANPIWWTGIQPGYGPGVLQGRQSGSDEAVAGCAGPFFTKTLTRLTFAAPDGTEIELRDMQTGGQPLQGGGCLGGGPSRGRTFISADGSAMTFISDADIYDDSNPHFPNVIYPSGYLMLRDGTRYRIDGGKTSWIRDANGNQVSFTYSGNDVVGIDDSLNRHISFTGEGISFKGANGVTRTITIHRDSLSNVLRKHPDGSTEFTTKTFSQLFPNLQNPQQGTFNPWVVKDVELPDGGKYEFRYDSYSNLAQVILPTGGRIEYDWTMGTYQHGDHVFGIFKRVIERRTALDATTPTYETRTIYPVPAMITNGPTEVTVDSVDPKNGNALLARAKHYFYGGWLPSLWAKATDYPSWQEGREYKTELFASDGTTVLRRIDNTWQQKTGVSWWTSSSDGAPANDPRLVDVTTTLVDNNQVTKTTAISPINGSIGFDQYNNQTDVWEYDYGSGVAGPLLRHTHTSYLTSGYDTLNPVWNNPDLSLTYHIRNLAAQISVFDGSANERARTTYEYDNYVADSATFHAALVNRSNISGHDTSIGTSFYNRGNVTAVSQYLLPAGSAITSFNQYDIAGNVTKVLDPRSTPGNVIATSIGYDDNFGGPDASLAERYTFTELGSQQTFAFPTQVTNAIGQNGYIQYDYGLGQAINQQDFNGIISAVFHDDSLDRMTQIRRAYSTAAESHATITYDDTGHTITTTSDQLMNNDNRLVSMSIYDGFGRTVETRQYESPTSYIAVQTQYDARSRAYKTSNPFRPLAPDNEVARWTTSTFDGLGRVLTVTTPDNAVLTTNYLGNAVTASDQIGKARKSITDALGRLKTIYEDPSGLNYQTDYGYDTLDNLTSVTQGTQPSRTFVYDSLKRLTSATNPENGTVSYQYSNAGSLIVRTDARGVSMHALYDSLNRITRRWYNGSSSTTETTHNSPALPSTVGATDEANFYYDSQTLPTGAPSYTLGTSTGRPIAVTYGGATSTAGDYFGYDNAGRNIVKVQRTGGVNYQMSASLNVSGGINSVTYPSGRSVNYSYDSAGRTSAVTGSLGDGTTRNYSTEIIYSPLGGLTKEKFGTTTAVYNKLFYNNRGQLSEIRDSTSWTGANDTTWNRGAIINHYSDQCSGMCGGSNSATAMTDNNGNLRKQEVYIPNDDDQVYGYTLRSQQYDYDSLNRLNWAREVKDEAEQWRQWFKYDRWGNRTIDLTQDPGDPHLRTYGVTGSQFKIDPQTNQLYAPNDQFLPNDQTNNLMKYDQAGNLKHDAYTGAGNRTYDAENRITSAWGGNNQAQLYSYDAGGQRVKRTVDGVQTFQVHGFGGELVAEYPATPTPGSPQKEYAYRNGQLLITATGASSGRTNYALTANGATATASSTYSGYPLVPSAAIDGEHKGLNWPNGGGWHSSSASFPQWLEVAFNGSKTIDEIDIYTVQDNPTNPAEPTETMTFSLYGLTGFDVQYWNGSTWATVTGGSVTGNNKVWKKVSFSAITTTKIRVLTNASIDGWSRITELEAWGGTRSNVALTANGATATASSTYSGYPLVPSAAIDGEHKGLNWPNGGGWHSSSATFPQWLEVAFNGSKTIDEIDIYTVQDNPSNPAEPTETMTFSLYGLTGFDVQYWNGSAWATVTGGSVTGNNKVWKKVSFSAITTTKIRVLINASIDGWSRITELEAWGNQSGGASTSINWLVTDHLGTPRMVLDQSGELANVKRHDYLPFGEELLAPTGGRSQAQGYSGDGVRQQFTSKERDVETGLDYFLARYYSSSQGRFVSVDPLMASAHASHPQTWNRYSYVLNNPLRLTDSTGMAVDTMSENEKEKKKAEQAEKQMEPPQQPLQQQPNILDLRQDPNIVSAVQEIKENAAPLKKGERPILTSVVVVPGQVSNVENTRLIDAYGNVSPLLFTGTVQPIGVIPLDQGCNIIPSGNGVLLQELVKSVRGPDPGSSDPAPAPDSGVFIDIQSLGKGLPTVEINQNVKVQQGRIQIETGPNRVIKDAGAGTISFTEGPQTKRVFQ